jgi:hypothetical protein
MIRDGIEPRIPGVRTLPVGGFSDGPVLLVRVPKSYSAPHMVTFKGTSRFFSRSNNGKYQLDVQEIRSAFALSESLPERIRRFRDERVARIVAGEIPFPVATRSKIVLHVLPISSLMTGTAVNLELLKDQHHGLSLPCFQQPVRDCRFNFDGLLSFDTQAETQGCVAYAQCFRNGAVEFVDGWTLASCADDPAFSASRVELVLVKGLREYARILEKLEVLLPLVVMPSLLGVRGCVAVHGRFADAQHPIDRNDLFLPDVLMEDLKEDAANVLRPAFDAMWQASGWRRSQNYGDDDRWLLDS